VVSSAQSYVVILEAMRSEAVVCFVIGSVNNMKIYNIQYRENDSLYIQQVKASSLQEAKNIVQFKNSLRANQILPDEAIL